MNELTGQTVELLQTLIRNQCVNDGAADSGHETRNADVLRQFLAGSGLRSSMNPRTATNDPPPAMAAISEVPMNPRFQSSIENNRKQATKATPPPRGVGTV